MPRAKLTECYAERGVLYPEFVPLLNALIENPHIHCGILSRNYTLNPGPTMRTVLRRSGVHEADLDFVVPIPIGVKKIDVLAAIRSTRYRECLLGADEIGDYHAAVSAGYDSVIASYGFVRTTPLTCGCHASVTIAIRRGAELSQRLSTVATLSGHCEMRVTSYPDGASELNGSHRQSCVRKWGKHARDNSEFGARCGELG